MTAAETAGGAAAGVATSDGHVSSSDDGYVALSAMTVPDGETVTSGAGATGEGGRALEEEGRGSVSIIFCCSRTKVTNSNNKNNKNNGNKSNNNNNNHSGNIFNIVT